MAGVEDTRVALLTLWSVWIICRRIDICEMDGAIVPAKLIAAMRGVGDNAREYAWD